jgi:enamine deaminase RidA (YjgF/YER057c/UK114 family)
MNEIAIDRKHTNARMSKIVRYAGMVFLCGQTSNGTDIADAAGQTREILKRIDTLLAEAGTGKSRLLSATIYLRNTDDFDAMNGAWEAWLPAGQAPVRTTVQAPCAGPGLLVEITVIAAA